MCAANDPGFGELKLELKQNLVEWLSLEDVKAEEIDDQAALFGEGLSLDSLDAVELVVMLHRKYGIRPKELSEKKMIFTSIDSLAAYVHEHRNK